MLFVGKIFNSLISNGRQQKELFVATHCYLRILTEAGFLQRAARYEVLYSAEIH